MTAVQKEAPGRWYEGGNRKAELLARLATDPQILASGHHFLPLSAEARLAALLMEIDEIVLPRLLQLQSGLRDVARLTVSHRRLIGIDMPDRSAIPADTDDLPGRLADRLVEIAATRGELLLSIGRRPSLPNHAETACSVNSLYRALALATTQNAFDRLLRHAGSQSVAQLVWAAIGLQPQFSGAPEWALPLQTFAENYMAIGPDRRIDARVGPFRTAGLLVPLTDDQVLVIASLETNGFAAILPRQIGLELISAWQSEPPRHDPMAKPQKDKRDFGCGPANAPMSA